MNSENEFEFKENTYIAVDEFYECAKCAFEFIDCTIGIPRPPCNSNKRSDGKNINFEVKK
jgi:hypothetical protein